MGDLFLRCDVVVALHMRFVLSIVFGQRNDRVFSRSFHPLDCQIFPFDEQDRKRRVASITMYSNRRGDLRRKMATLPVPDIHPQQRHD